MEKLALTFPGNPNSTSSGRTQTLMAPSGIPSALKGGDLKSSGLIQTGYNIFFMSAIFLAIMFMLFSGVSFITSGGDVNKVAGAKRKMVYSVLGLLVVLLAFVIVNILFKILGINAKTFFF